MDSTEIDAIDKIIEGLEKLDIRVGDKKMCRNLFFTEAVKAHAELAISILQKRLSKIGEVQA